MAIADWEVACLQQRQTSHMHTGLKLMQYKWLMIQIQKDLNSALV